MSIARRMTAAALVAAMISTGAGAAETADAPIDARIEPGLLAAREPVQVLARFHTAVPRALEALAGLDVAHRFRTVPAIYATATPEAVRALAARPDLVFLERDKPLAFDLDTATVASRARDVTDASFDPSTPAMTDGDGARVDGSGVGIAIVDTGLDGLHPDFAGTIGGNYQVTPAGVVPMPYTSPTDGHGTHVAGIAAGSGSLAAARGDGDLRGVAPGATLYGFNMFNATQVVAAIAFEWIIENGDEQQPPIRVVNNSWHCVPSACNHPFNAGPDGVPLHVALASDMARAGITVTWAAGNVRGNGDTSTVSPEANNPTPGIIGVANYKDDDSSYAPHQKGRRDGCLSGNSAWGASSDPRTWPDVAAPGRSINSTWAINASRDGFSPSSRNPVDGSRSYAVLTGTSMAAPHVAGIAALLLQMRPSLTPAEIEYIVKQTATPLTGPAGPGNDGCGIPYPKADAAHPWTGANYAAGHGLVHAYAAATLARTFAGIPPQVPEPESLPDGFVISTPGLDAEATLYLSSKDALTDAYPTGDLTARPMSPNTFLQFRADPLSHTTRVDAIKADLYVGTSGEYADLGYLGAFSVRTRVYRTPPGGEETQIAELATGRQAVYPGIPTHRRLVLRFASPITLEAGDRLRASVGVIASPYYTTDPPINAYWVLYTGPTLPSRIELGTSVPQPAPDSRAACERRTSCAMVDQTHPYEGVICGTAAFRLRWSGPGGSSLVFTCDGVASVCHIAGDAPGTCEMDVEPPPGADARATIHPDGSAARGGTCTYRLPDGGRGGAGRCEAIAT